MSTAISFSGVSRRYGALDVLRDVTFSVDRGDVVGIFGMSGAGKTTILKLAAGLVEPSSGTIEWNTGSIGYVFQEPRLLPWKTALDNVALPLVAGGSDLAAARLAARKWLSEMGLEGFGDYYPGRLSGGMAQRISLARAFAVEPDLLLLDEPFGALDIQTKDTMFSLLNRQLDAHPLTVLYVSHVPEDVVRIANRLLVLTMDGVVREVPVMEHGDLTAVLREML